MSPSDQISSLFGESLTQSLMSSAEDRALFAALLRAGEGRPCLVPDYWGQSPLLDRAQTKARKIPPAAETAVYASLQMKAIPECGNLALACAFVNRLEYEGRTGLGNFSLDLLEKFPGTNVRRACFAADLQDIEAKAAELDAITWKNMGHKFALINLELMEHHPDWSGAPFAYELEGLGPKGFNARLELGTFGQLPVPPEFLKALRADQIFLRDEEGYKRPLSEEPEEGQIAVRLALHNLGNSYSARPDEEALRRVDRFIEGPVTARTHVGHLYKKERLMSAAEAITKPGPKGNFLWLLKKSGGGSSRLMGIIEASQDPSRFEVIKRDRLERLLSKVGAGGGIDVIAMVNLAPLYGWEPFSQDAKFTEAQRPVLRTLHDLCVDVARISNVPLGKLVEALDTHAVNVAECDREAINQARYCLSASHFGESAEELADRMAVHLPKFRDRRPPSTRNQHAGGWLAKKLRPIFGQEPEVE